jgi:hypothetical protein
LILCALMNLTISVPYIKLLITMLFRILHILSILTGLNIFLNICLSKMHRLSPSFAVKVQGKRCYSQIILAWIWKKSVTFYQKNLLQILPRENILNLFM